MQPTPVEVVRGPKGPGFWRRVVEAIPTAIVTSILTAFFLALWAPNIATYVSLFRPSCADPRNLEEISPAEVAVAATSQDEGLDPARVLFDGRVANVWVPPLQPPSERPDWMSQDPDLAVVDRDLSVITVKLAKVENVQLICAVNGLANGYPNYVNWARVRSVQTWTDQDDGRELSTLHSMDAGSFQSFQDIDVSRGKTEEIMIQILDLYEGQQITSVDPDVCGTREQVGEGRQNDPVGCNLNPAPRGGLAEIKMYRLQESRWKALWPF